MANKERMHTCIRNYLAHGVIKFEEGKSYECLYGADNEYYALHPSNDQLVQIPMCDYENHFLFDSDADCDHTISLTDFTVGDITCPHCNKSITISVAYDMHDGTPYAYIQSVNGEAVHECPCGADIEIDWSFNIELKFTSVEERTKSNETES